MGRNISWIKYSVLFILAIFVGAIFLSDLVRVKATQASTLGLPEPNTILNVSASFSLPSLIGLKINPEKPLEFEFIIDGGSSQELAQDEIKKVVQYFMAALTVPTEDLWVNLSPYENDRIIPDSLGQTDLGKELLAQDYILKQISASLTHPDSEIGKRYWDIQTDSSKSNSALASSEFDKIWIQPGSINLYEETGSVIINRAELDVLTERDYIALQHNELLKTIKQRDSSSSQFLKKSILPEIRKAVNVGGNFARLRQLYRSLILAVWFKEKFKNSFYKHYIAQNKIKNLQLNDPDLKEKIYSLYCSAFEQGVYELIKTEKQEGKAVRRKYFAGGINNVNLSSSITVDNKLAPTTITENTYSVDLSFTVDSPDVEYYDYQSIMFKPDAPGELQEGVVLNYSSNKAVVSLSKTLDNGKTLALILNTSTKTQEGVAYVPLEDYGVDLNEDVEVFDFSTKQSLSYSRNPKRQTIVGNDLYYKLASGRAHFFVISDIAQRQRQKKEKIIKDLELKTFDYSGKSFVFKTKYNFKSNLQNQQAIVYQTNKGEELFVMERKSDKLYYVRPDGYTHDIDGSMVPKYKSSPRIDSFEIYGKQFDVFGSIFNKQNRYDNQQMAGDYFDFDRPYLTHAVREYNADRLSEKVVEIMSNGLLPANQTGRATEDSLHGNVVSYSLQKPGVALPGIGTFFAIVVDPAKGYYDGYKAGFGMSLDFQGLDVAGIQGRFTDELPKYDPGGTSLIDKLNRDEITNSHTPVENFRCIIADEGFALTWKKLVADGYVPALAVYNPKLELIYDPKLETVENIQEQKLETVNNGGIDLKDINFDVEFDALPLEFDIVDPRSFNGFNFKINNISKIADIKTLMAR